MTRRTASKPAPKAAARPSLTKKMLGGAKPADAGVAVVGNSWWETHKPSSGASATGVNMFGNGR